MNISDIYSAKGLKFKLSFSTSFDFAVGNLLDIKPAQNSNDFFIEPYGDDINSTSKKQTLCHTDDSTANYINDLFETQKVDSFRCMFSVEGVNASSIEVQAYTFKSVVEYKTPIFIQVSNELLEKTNVEKLSQEYVWTKLGVPALFCLNYKNRKKQQSDIRFLSGKRYITAQNTPRGIYVTGENYLKDRYTLPIDIYIAPEIKFISEAEAPQVNTELAKNLDTISNPASYFARWEAYNKLSKDLLIQESKEFGEYKFSSFTFESDLVGATFEFVVNEELDSSFLGKELGVTEKSIFSLDDKESTEKPKHIAVGSVKRITNNSIITHLETADGIDFIPTTGYLSLYTVGDKIIMARREAARDRMINHKSPIKSIVALIEAGASEYELSGDWGHSKPITDELKKNYSKAGKLNPEQIEALDTAINTPDIALIQGPPGTGKTTVIKAICERFREIYEAEERRLQKNNPEHALRSPKILISSFQNEAVDNAISTPLPGDIPAYRKTAKRVKNNTTEQYQKSLDKWYAGVKASITDFIDDKTAAEFVESRNRLCDEYISYKNSGEEINKAATLIKHYLSFSDIVYPQHLINDAIAVIKAADSDSGIDDIEDPIIAKLESQRLDRLSFEDDGLRNAKRLLSHIKLRDDLPLEGNDINYITKICEGSFSNSDFENYVNVITRLQKQFCSNVSYIDAKDKALVNKCLISLQEAFSTQYIKTLNNVDSKKSLILSEFLSRLDQEYESIVRKYSMTTAATCQTSLDLRAEMPRVFDLVVIDEAARANPLDLFIPMSMGKKIVLVGDHKQLPHMLEPDVLQMLMQDPKFKDLPEIEKSLFERLFEMFLKGQKPKSVPLTQQYRMHPDICKFVSHSFYDDKLTTHPSVTSEMRSSPNTINNGKPLTFVNIPITKGAETPGASKSRIVEVEAITKDVKFILETDKESTIGIITFYSAQATKLKQNLDIRLNEEELARVEIGTVDAFQGKEFDYVLLSCVRSNKPKSDSEGPTVGFLEKPNRLCVAFSRAIKQLIAYGDAETLFQIPCFAELYDICSNGKGGCYREY